MYNFAQKGNYDIVITNNYIHSKKSISLYIGVNDTEKTTQQNLFKMETLLDQG